MVHTTPKTLRVGTLIPMVPIAPIPENCIETSAGPVTFVVESRQLTPDLVNEDALSKDGLVDRNVPADLDDFGAALHVYGAGDGLEYLRFDCFEHDAHYHYILNKKRAHIVCPLDKAALGDPLAWTVSRLRERLPEMLEHAGAPELAAAVREEKQDVLSAVDQVQRLLEKAQIQAIDDRKRR